MFRTVSVLLALGWTCLLLFSSCASNGYDESKDELFFGLSFGMNRLAFFDTCWDNNQKGLTEHGTRDNAVLVLDSTRFDDLVEINFFPEFHNDLIYEMPITYNYSAWAPWLKNRFSDSLIIDVKKVVEEQFDIILEERTIDNRTVGYVFVDDPLVYKLKKKDDRFVEFVITNHRYNDEL